MSNNVKRDHSKQPVGKLELRPRRFRHGRVQVGVAPAGHHDERPSPYVRRWKTVETGPTGEFVTKEHSRPMTQEEVQAERARVLRATGSTQSYGLENKPDNMAPKGKGGAKPGPGGAK